MKIHIIRWMHFITLYMYQGDLTSISTSYSHIDTIWIWVHYRSMLPRNKDEPLCSNFLFSDSLFFLGFSPINQRKKERKRKQHTLLSKILYKFIYETEIVNFQDTPVLKPNIFRSWTLSKSFRGTVKHQKGYLHMTAFE